MTLEPTSLFVKGELGRELYNRGEYTRAEVELKELVAAAAGDNRALAPALKELGATQAKAHENDEALATLKRALPTAGEQSALRGGDLRDDHRIYRADQRLPELVKQLEAEHPGDFARLALLGLSTRRRATRRSAIATYRRALGREPSPDRSAPRMIRLLQSKASSTRRSPSTTGSFARRRTTRSSSSRSARRSFSAAIARAR